MELKQLEIQKQSPSQTAPATQRSNALPATHVSVRVVSRQWFSLEPEYWCFFKSEFAQSFNSSISRKTSVGEMGGFFQLSQKCHWSVLVVSEEWFQLQGDSHAGVGVMWGVETLSDRTQGPLKLLSTTAICTAATALACFSLPSSIALKYVNTSCTCTPPPWKPSLRAAGSIAHLVRSLPYPICRLESSSSCGPYAWWDAQATLLSCVLLGFLMRPLETMQWLQDPN